VFQGVPSAAIRLGNAINGENHGENSFRDDMIALNELS
jgi:hypothetical protein